MAVHWSKQYIDREAFALKQEGRWIEDKSMQEMDGFFLLVPSKVEVFVILKQCMVDPSQFAKFRSPRCHDQSVREGRLPEMVVCRPGGG